MSSVAQRITIWFGLKDDLAHNSVFSDKKLFPLLIVVEPWKLQITKGYLASNNVQSLGTTTTDWLAVNKYSQINAVNKQSNSHLFHFFTSQGEVFPLFSHFFTSSADSQKNSILHNLTMLGIFGCYQT